MTMVDARVSVVLITRDRAPELARTLRRLRQLPERPETVVVDNGSGDQTVTMVGAHFPEVRVVALGTNWGAAGRNAGVEAVETPYVAFCDDDTWWAPGALGKAADLLDAHPRVAVVTAHITVEPDGSDDPICEDLAGSPLPDEPDLPGPRLISFLAGASVVRRDAFVVAGGFEPRLLIGGEEEWLSSDLLSAGWALVYAPDIGVHHHASPVRDPDLRRRQGIRNTLWFTWARRPLPRAARRTARVLTSLPLDRVSAAGVLDAVGGLRWVLGRRRVVAPEVEALYSTMDGVQLRSKARRYVS